MSSFLLSALFLPLSWTGDLGRGQQPSGYPHAEMLVEAVELAKPEVAKRFLVLDARSKNKYAAGHIPGAIWVDHGAWSKADLRGQNHELWSKRIGELGIDKETRVIVYDDNASKDAARIWWILRYWGIRDARLLNGGWQAWQISGGRVSGQENKPPARKLTLFAEAARLATKDEVLDVLEKKEVQIVDARSRAEYCGEEKMAKRGGAIPGAIHLEWLDVLDQKSQRFKNPEDLAGLFKKNGIALDRATVTYCQSGGRAAVMAFALELMGAKRMRNYYKSWAEWGNADDTPITKPDK